MDSFAAFEAGVDAGASEARRDLTGWVLLAGDPRGGLSVIGPFPTQEAAEAHASRWNGTDWRPVPLRRVGAAESEWPISA